MTCAPQQPCIASCGGFGDWMPAETPPNSWRLVAWAWRGGGYAAGYYGGKQVDKSFRGWHRYDWHANSTPDFWCDFPPLPNNPISHVLSAAKDVAL